MKRMQSLVLVAMLLAPFAIVGAGKSTGSSDSAKSAMDVYDADAKKKAAAGNADKSGKTKKIEDQKARDDERAQSIVVSCANKAEPKKITFTKTFKADCPIKELVRWIKQTTGVSDLVLEASIFKSKAVKPVGLEGTVKDIPGLYGCVTRSVLYSKPKRDSKASNAAKTKATVDRLAQSKSRAASRTSIVTSVRRSVSAAPATALVPSAAPAVASTATQAELLAVADTSGPIAPSAAAVAVASAHSAAAGQSSSALAVVSGASARIQGQSAKEKSANGSFVLINGQKLDISSKTPKSPK